MERIPISVTPERGFGLLPLGVLTVIYRHPVREKRHKRIRNVNNITNMKDLVPKGQYKGNWYLTHDSYSLYKTLYTVIR